MIETATVASGNYNGIRWEIISIGKESRVYWLTINGIHCFTFEKYLGTPQALIEGQAGEYERMDNVKLLHEEVKTMPSGECITLQIYQEEDGRMRFCVYSGNIKRETLPPYRKAGE